MNVEPNSLRTESRIWKWARTHTSLKLAVLFAVVFSASIMFASFSYRNGDFLVNDKVWSDFMSHIPLVRSFTYGHNMPPEYPLFSGERIRYHFSFYLLTSFLERSGLRLDIALNTLSILGMAGLMIAVYLLALKLSGKKTAGWLALFLLILNSSLSWMYVFGAHTGNAWQRVSQVVHGTSYLSFGPWDGRLISAFWNLNIFINQRHFAFSLALVFLAVWGIYYRTGALALITGIVIIGAMSWTHKAALLLLLATLGCLFFGDPKKRVRVLIAAITGSVLSIPGLLYLNSAGPAHDPWQPMAFLSSIATYNPGFLYKTISLNWLPVTAPFLQWCVYWFFQTGLLPFAAFAGWVLVGSEKPDVSTGHGNDSSSGTVIHETPHPISLPLGGPASPELERGEGAWGGVIPCIRHTPPNLPSERGGSKKEFYDSRLRKLLHVLQWISRNIYHFVFSEHRIWGIVGLAIFALANLFTFSPEVAANHKLINYPIIIANVYAAIFLVHLWRKRIIFKVFALLLAFFLMLGGMVDLFPIFNSNKVAWHDLQRDATAFWIVNNTKPRDRFFNLTYETAPLATSGRSVYWGWDYFPWSLGYDLPGRKAAAHDIVAGTVSKAQACAFLRQNKLAFVYMDTATARFMDAPVNREFFARNFVKVSPVTLPLAVYDVEKSCMAE